MDIVGISNVKVGIAEALPTIVASVNVHNPMDCDLLIELQLDPRIRSPEIVRNKVALLPCICEISVRYIFSRTFIPD